MGLMVGVVATSARGAEVAPAPAPTPSVLAGSGSNSSTPHFTYGQAKDFAKSGEWAKARDAAEDVTKNDPKEAKNWYLLGVTEQRLEHAEAAATAFQRVLDLEPSGPLARAVSVTLPALKVKGDAELKYKYGPDSSGVFLGYSPSAGIAAARQIDSSATSSVEGGFRLGKFQVGFRYASGDVSKIYAPQPGTAYTSTAPNYLLNASGGSHTFKELYVNALLPVLDPYGKAGGLQLNIPLFFGGFINSLEMKSGVTANGSGKTFGNIGWDFATGLHAMYYTKSPFAVELSGMYHFGFPFWDIRQDGNSEGIQGPNHERVSGGTTGFEVALGLDILFGASRPDEF